MTHKKTGINKKSSLERALEDSALKKHYLKEAEKLFMGSKGRPEHEKDLKKLHNSYGKKSFRKNAAEYVKKYGLPEEWGALMMLLDLKDDPDMVCDVIDRLVERACAGCTASEQRGLESKLRIMEMTEPDPDIQEAAQEALARL
jgi:hypothetical protein